MADAQEGSPLVWILRGPTAGDYAQLLALAESLGWQFVTKKLVFRGYELLLHARPRPSLAALNRAASDALQPPWPDLILTAGRRNELVARWIQRAAGGRPRLVHVGRPWSHPTRFDLVISTQQYLLEPSERVIVNDLPLHDVDLAALSRDAAPWKARWEHLPRPWTVLLVGGDSGPLVFSRAHARELARRTDALLETIGGSLLVSTSRRTPVASGDTLLASLRHAPAYCWRFGDPGDNPYRALLALGEQFVVTGDSMSMLAEACATGKPVYLYDFPEARPWWRCLDQFRWRPFVHRLTMAVGPRRMRRDVRRIHRALLTARRAQRLGESHVSLMTDVRCDDELERSAARVRALFA
jgi:mitochondrial fission protein ELM1